MYEALLSSISYDRYSTHGVGWLISSGGGAVAATRNQNLCRTLGRP